MFPIDLPALLNADECDQLIDWSEAEGYVDHTLNPEGPPVHARCEVGERLPAFVVDRVVDRLRTHFPYAAVGESTRPPVLMRFDPAQRLPPAPGNRPEGDELPWTFVLCLAAADGGETICYPAPGPFAGAAQKGQAFLFPSFLTSEETPARLGRRYILRGEIILRPGDEAVG